MDYRSDDGYTTSDDYMMIGIMKSHVYFAPEEINDLNIHPRNKKEFVDLANFVLDSAFSCLDKLKDFFESDNYNLDAGDYSVMLLGIGNAIGTYNWLYTSDLQSYIRNCLNKFKGAEILLYSLDFYDKTCMLSDQVATILIKLYWLKKGVDPDAYPYPIFQRDLLDVLKKYFQIETLESSAQDNLNSYVYSFDV